MKTENFSVRVSSLLLFLLHSHPPPWSAFCLLPLRPHCSTVQLQLLLILLLLLLTASRAVTRFAPRFLAHPLPPNKELHLYVFTSVR